MAAGSSAPELFTSIIGEFQFFFLYQISLSRNILLPSLKNRFSMVEGAWCLLKCKKQAGILSHDAKGSPIRTDGEID